MKLKSISGVAFFVSNLDATIKFYEKLGFRLSERKQDHVIAYVNWFWVEFRLRDSGDGNKPVAGMDQFLYINVDDIEESYKSLLDKGLKPAAQPSEYFGRRQFIVMDPDGYLLVFFQKG